MHERIKRTGIWLLCSFILIFASAKPVFSYENISDEMVTLKWMIYGEKLQEWDNVFNAFNKELHKFFPNVSVEFEVVKREEYEKQWAMKMAANERVDIAWIGSEEVSFSKEVKKGNLMAIDYLLSAYGQDLQASVTPELWEKEKRDGNTYGIPVIGPLYQPNYTLIANKNLMQLYGNFEEIVEVNQNHTYTNKECFMVMEPFLKAVKEHNALGKGVSYKTICSIADKGYDGIYGFNSPFVIRIFDENPIVLNKYMQESYRDCFEVMADWYQKGYIREDVAYLLNPLEEDGKTSGNIIFVQEYGENMSVFDQKIPEYDCMVGELDGYRYISYDTYRNCLVIPKTSKYPQEAMKILNLLHSDEGQELFQMITCGIEKQDYIYVDEQHKIIARMTEDGKYKYSVNPVNFGNMFLGQELCQNQFDTVSTYNATAIHSPIEGFELDTRMIDIYMARIDLIVEKYLDRLCQGISDDWEAEYEMFCEEMEQAGSQKVIEEIQRQIDRFMAEP